MQARSKDTKEENKKDEENIDRIFNDNSLFIFEEDRKVFEELAKNNKYLESKLNYGTK